MLIFAKGDLVELLTQIGVKRAGRLSPAQLRQRAVNAAIILDRQQVLALTVDARRTLAAVGKAIDEEIELDPKWLPAPPRRKKRRGKLHAYPHLALTRGQGRVLFDWLKKIGKRDRKAEWGKLRRAEKEDAIAEAVERMVEAFLANGEM